MPDPPINYLNDDEDSLYPNAGTPIQQQQDEGDFEQDVADPNRPPMVMVQTPKGPLPVVINQGGVVHQSDPQGGDDSQDSTQAQARPAMPPGARFNGSPSLPPPVQLPPQPSADPLLQKISQAPVLTKPNWLQKLAAGAVGAGAGWSNAASRTRTPINVQGATENILHPGYAQAQEVYQSQLNPIQQGYQIEASRNIQAMKNLQTQTKANLENAQAQQNIDRGAYWLHRASQDPNRFKVGPKGEVVDQQTGAVQYAPQTPEEHVAALVKAGWSMHDAQMAVINPTHFGVDQRPSVIPQGAAIRNADGTYDIPNPRPPKERDPVADELARLRIQDSQANENTRIDSGKQAAEQRLLQQRAHEITQLQNSGTPDDKLAARMAEINSRYASQLQGVQNNYEQAVKGHGGNAEHFNVKVTPDGYITYEKATQGGIAVPPPVMPTAAPPPSAAAPPKTASSPQQQKQRVPPLSKLAPGMVTHFRDGSAWIIGPNGQPQQVSGQ